MCPLARKPGPSAHSRIASFRREKKGLRQLETECVFEETMWTSSSSGKSLGRFPVSRSAASPTWLAQSSDKRPL